MTVAFRGEAGSIKHTATAARSSGDVIDLTDRIGIAMADIASGAEGTVATQGVFKLAKDDTVFAEGADVDWDLSALKCSELGEGVAGDILHIGKCVKAAATGKSYVLVEINVPITAETVSA